MYIRYEIGLQTAYLVSEIVCVLARESINYFASSKLLFKIYHVLSISLHYFNVQIHKFVKVFHYFPIVWR